MSKGNGSESKLSQYIKAPYRALRHARDLYESSMSGIAGKSQRGPIIALPRAHGFGQHSRRSSSEEEINELIRAACKSKMRAIPVKEDGTLVPRSHSVATMRIDEDKPCDFEDDLKVALGPRSRSYDVATKRKVVFSDQQ
ncbi:hypothetical protein OPV22_028063 [Ensete ventricosum]|uniref:Uncharacterized protein n=1 Tax=Ensete ventricosum TaxID=4639 RepID=A0AAV8P4R7_ENSVE|nr:hypothetical protein OPV22_028063 [Ensete ventricosum]